MPKEGKAWGTYGNKPKQDRETGAMIEAVKCSIDFPEGTKVEDIKFNNQKVFIYTEHEHNVKQSEGGTLQDIFGRLDVLASGFLQLTAEVEKEIEKRNEAIKEVTPIPEEG